MAGNKEGMTVKEAGELGGKARAEKYSKEELSNQAKQAARTIEEKHPGFHAEIGSKGGSSRGGTTGGRDEDQNR